MIFKVTWGEDLRTWVTSQGSCFQAPGRKKDILGPHRALPFGYQTIEIVDPKKLEFPQESRAGGRERLIPTSQKRNLPPPIEISHSSARVSNHLAGGPGGRPRWSRTTI